MNDLVPPPADDSDELRDTRRIRISARLMVELCTRDNEGNRLRVTWGEPDAEGFYSPTVHVDYDDNPFRAP